MLVRGRKDFGNWAGEAWEAGEAALRLRSVAEGQGVEEVAKSDET